MSFHHNSRSVCKKFKSPFKEQTDSTPIASNDLSEYQTLCKKEASLDDDISELIGVETDVKNVMKLLHEYNEIKDVTQIVLGRLASLEGQTLKEVHERFGLEDK